jgi:hypothetical protein
MVMLAPHVSKAFATCTCNIAGEALRVLADALRYGVRMHDGSLHDGIANRHLTEHGLMSGGLELDTFHRCFLVECVRLLGAPTPPKFGGQLCEVLLWSALAFDRDALAMFCSESTWRILLRRLSVSEYWDMYTDWQQVTASAQCAPVAAKADWLKQNAQGLATATSTTLQLMRLMILGDDVPSFLGAECLELAVEATVNLLAEAFETKTVFDDDAFARVNQSSYELLSTLLVRTEDAASATVRQALRRAVGLTVRTAGRSDGSTLVDSLTLCMLSAAPHLEIAACQFMDLAITDASDLLMLHMTSTQVNSRESLIKAAAVLL